MSKFSRGHTKAAKLTATQVLEIRELYNQGFTQGALSKQFHISVVQIGRIVRGEVWQQYQQPAHPDEIEDSLAKLRGDVVEVMPPADLMDRLAGIAPSADVPPPIDPLEAYLRRNLPDESNRPGSKEHPIQHSEATQSPSQSDNADSINSGKSTEDKGDSK